MEFNDLFMRNKMGLDIDEFIPANITVARKNYLDLLDNGEIKMVGNTLKSKKMPIYIEKFIAQGYIELFGVPDGYSYDKETKTFTEINGIRTGFPL